MVTTLSEATQNVEQQEQKQVNAWNSVFMESAIVRVARVDELKTSASDVTYVKFLVAQNEEYGNRTNWFSVVAYINDKTNVGDIINNHLTVGSLIQLKNIRVEYSIYQGENGAVLSNTIHLNSNKQLKFLHIKK